MMPAFDILAARVIRDSKEDLPALGSPTRPTSASSLSRSSIQRSSPGSPFSANRGACRVGVAKRLLPRPPAPPRATTTRVPGTTRSWTVPSSRVTCVPGGTLTSSVAPSAPCRLEPSP